MKVLSRHTLPDVGQAVLGYMSFFLFFSIKLDILGNKDEMLLDITIAMLSGLMEP